jgi:integrase
LPGFGLRIRAGGAKSYLLRYRPGGGRKASLRTFTIGKHGAPWTAEQARKEAQRLMALVKQDLDPQAERMKARRGLTVKELFERFLAEHAEAKRKARTAEEYRRLINRVIVPAIGNRKAADIGRPDIARLHGSLRRVPYEANRALAVISKCFNLAETWGIRPDGSNPCRHIEKFRERKRERMLSMPELAALGDAIAGSSSTYAVAAIRLLLLTGARRNEVLGLRWDWVDFQRGEARLPDSKGGAKTLHLPPPALKILAEVPRIQGNPHVIVGEVKGAHLVNVSKPWTQIRRAASVALWQSSDDPATAALVSGLAAQHGRAPTAEECEAAAATAGIKLPGALVDLRLHDLRHAFGSIAASSGMGLPIIGKLLGHTQPATTARYAHLQADPVKAAAASVADQIAAGMAGAQGADVIKLPKR